MSACVTITLDSDRLLDIAPGTLLVEKVADYPKACLAVRTALKSRKRIAIGVRQKQVAVWLSSFAQAYGEENVAVDRYTPTRALADRWNIAVPPGITDADIMQSRLLDVSLSARTGQSFSDLILEHFYSSFFAFQTLPVSHLALLLNDYDADRWKAAGRRPLVVLTLKERLNQWYDKAQNDAVRTVVNALREDPEGLRRALCGFKVLRNYPNALGQKVLGNRWEVFAKAKIDTDALDLAFGDNVTTTEIEYYLTGLQGQIGGTDDLALLLRQMSGYLDIEFRFVEAQLRAHPEWITSDLLRSLEQRFFPIRSRIGKSLALLRKLIKPAFPIAPEPDWNAAQWLSWVQQSYMPYYAWLEVQGKQDDTVSLYAATFADWYYENFISLKNGQPERFAFSALYREKSRVTAPDVVTLALLVDNFNLVHFDELRRVFGAHGIALTSSEPLFSLIPTATEIGKAALIATTGNPAEISASGYSALVDKEWGQASSGKQVTYLPNIGALQQLISRDAELYFLNFLPIDEALHQNALETGRPHGEVIYEHLATLAQTVADFAKRFQLEKRLLVYVLSDHGATRIAQGVVNVLDQSYYKNVTDKNHHRYLPVADDKFVKLPQMAETQCYLIDRHKFKTAQNYVVARQYYRFLPTTDTFYVHGGLTPEEVVVPFAQFTLVSVVPDDPTLNILNTEFRYSVKSRIKVEVGNPNGFAIEAVRIRLMDTDAEEIVLDSLGAKEQKIVELVTTFRKTIGGANVRTLTVRVRYVYQGTEYTAPDRGFEVAMKAMMEEKDNFGDIF